MSFNKKTNSSKLYLGVYHTNDDKWMARLTHKGKQMKFGPFSTDKEAAQKYDAEILKIFPQRSRLNFPNKIQTTKSDSSRLLAIRKKFDKTLGKKLSKGQHKKENYIREQFPIATRNLICARQKWKCNFCVETLTDIFIIDHMVPLFLGGSNSTHNLQALCPSCDRFKTSYLDHKVLKPLHQKNGKLTAEEVSKIQIDNYHTKTCQSPDNNNDNDNDNNNDNDNATTSEETTVAEEDITTQKTNDVEIKIGKTLVRISSLV